MKRACCMEMSFFQQLHSDRRELMDFAKSLGSADAMRAAREDLMKQISVLNLTPKTQKDYEKLYTVENGIACIPIVGELTAYAQKDACGAYTANALTEYGFIAAAIQKAEKDESVESLDFHINSPGGYTDGIGEVSLIAATCKKPTRSFIGSMCASAAYWFASGTGRIIAKTKLSRAGSIGVAIELYDDSEYLKGKGLKRYTLTSTDAPEKRPDIKTDEGQKAVIKYLDDIHKVFVDHVAEGRGVSVETVNQQFGKGGVLTAENALNVGMIDEIEGNTVQAPEISNGKKGASASFPVVNGNNNTAADGGKKEDVLMTIEELKKDHLEAYQKAAQDGINTERARRNAIDEIAKADPDNEKLRAVCAQAIEDGITPDSPALSAKVTAAIRDGGMLEGENAPGVQTLQNDPVKLSDEDKEAAELAGMTHEEYAKWIKEAE